PDTDRDGRHGGDGWPRHGQRMPRSGRDSNMMATTQKRAPTIGSASAHQRRRPMPAIRTEDDGAVRRLVLCRPEEFNTITPELRDELDGALDAAEHDNSVSVVLLVAEGRAFCA